MHTAQLGQPSTEDDFHSRLFSKSDLTRVLLVSVLLSLPFLNKAFHIDDPVVLQCAKRILIGPLDPWGGEFDWLGVAMPFWQVTTNPPLLSYYLAPFVSIFGYSEIILHLAMMPFLAGILAGCLALSKRIQTMSFPEASFYAVIRRTVPFVFSREPIETLRVYRVE